MHALMLVFLLVSIGCARAEANGSSAAVEGPKSGYKKAEITPEITRKAEEILNSNADAPIGTEIPFSLNGRRYTARIEEHDNSEGDPSRPRDKHKGVTVYVMP